MRITLQIENVDRLENGGQLYFSCSDRGFDIGRHEHLDWSLPDPNRVISGKHCEVRFEGGQFVLYDCSTNGTFLNGSPTRMDKAHALRAGDKVMIGDYIIAVSLEGAPAGVGAGSPAAAQHQPWDAPQSAFGAGGPAWPAATAPSPAAQPSYPLDNSPAGPWAAGQGMEGRHAPPSGDPGIGTPADDVWSQQGHGWGTADPSLYDPRAQYAEREAARPAQADPLDHLADQPFLQKPVMGHPSQGFDVGGSETGSPFPQTSSAGATTGGAPTNEPLFQMPDLSSAEETGGSAGSPPVLKADPASPLPGDHVWGTPEGDAAPATANQEPTPLPEMPTLAAEPEPVSASNAPSAGTGDLVAATPVAEPGASVQPMPAAGSIDFIKAFAEGAGIPASALAESDPEAFAREVGAILQGITGDLMGLLQARSQVKAMTRNANRTLIMRSGNNALKFSPTPQMALQTMLAPGAEENGYLPLPQAMREAFKDIQKHHVWTYAAMQKAAARFEEKLSPKAIEDEGQVGKSTFGNHKAKLWDRLQERWSSLSGAYDDGVVGLFTQYFTEGYEELTGEDPDQNTGRIN